MSHLKAADFLLHLWFIAFVDCKGVRQVGVTIQLNYINLLKVTQCRAAATI